MGAVTLSSIIATNSANQSKSRARGHSERKENFEMVENSCD